jgi:hypothetical protein
MSIIKISLTNDPSKVWTFDCPLTLMAINKIECITELDEGSGNFTDGMIYGKEYEFKVSEYYEDFIPTEEEKKEIIWEYAYSNDEDGVTIVTQKEPSGETFKLKVDNLDMLGKEVSVYAYYGDKETEGILDIFCHNRFRYFDWKAIEQELNKRKNNPELANQSRTPTCGIASIFYILAKQDFDKYQNFILDLHRTGIAKCNSYEVDVSKCDHLLEVNPILDNLYPILYGKKMPYIDWIPFSCLRDLENDLPISYNGKMSQSPLDEFSGATLPHEIEKLMKEVLGFKKIINDTNLVFNKDSQDFGEISARELKKLQDLYLDGYQICLFINTNMIYNKESAILSTIEHWVVFEGIIGGTISWDEYDFKVFTWGAVEKITINPESFRSNYYGYVAGK